MKSVVKFFQVTMLWIVLLPFTFSFIGAASNQAVLIANRDTFPVLLNDKKLADVEAGTLNAWSPKASVPEYGEVVMLDDVHCAMTSKTHLNFLADIFDVKIAIMSVGDMLIDLGTWLGSFCGIVWLALVSQKLRQL